MRALNGAFGLLALAAALLGPAPSWARSAHTAPTLLVLQDAYAVAHGMAASYVRTAKPRPEIVLQLARLDIRARAALDALQRAPHSHSQRSATAAAVARLTDYETSLSVASR